MWNPDVSHRVLGVYRSMCIACWLFFFFFADNYVFFFTKWTPLSCPFSLWYQHTSVYKAHRKSSSSQLGVSGQIVEGTGSNLGDFGSDRSGWAVSAVVMNQPLRRFWEGTGAGNNAASETKKSSRGVEMCPNCYLVCEAVCTARAQAAGGRSYCLTRHLLQQGRALDIGDAYLDRGAIVPCTSGLDVPDWWGFSASWGT